MISNLLSKLIQYYKDDPLNVTLEFFGFLFSMVGSLLVANKIQQGWILYSFANIFFIIFSIRKKMVFIVILNLWFIVTNCIGIYNYLL